MNMINLKKIIKAIKNVLVPFRLIYDFIKFLIWDIASDIKWLWNIRKQHPYYWNDIKLQIKEQLQVYSYQKFKDDMKKAYIWYIIIVLAFFCGAFIGGKYYEMKCHNIIYENYIKNNPLHNVTFVESFVDTSTPTENGSKFTYAIIDLNNPDTS